MSDSRLREFRRIVNAAPGPSSDNARQVMRANRRRDSKAEIELRRTLHRTGRRFRVDYPIRVAGRRPIRPDVVFTRARVAVFVDGCFWHGCPKHGTRPRANADYWEAKIALNQARDDAQVHALEEAGWTVVRVWEHEQPTLAADRVAEILDAQAASDSGATASSASRRLVATA